MIQKWYEQALTRAPKHRFGTHEFTIYKGFKITLEYENNNYIVEDVRFNDFYKTPSPQVLEQFKTKGFLKAVDDLVFERDKRRLKSTKRKMEQLFEKIKDYKRVLKSRPEFFTKKINNARDNIMRFSSDVAFYRVRISNHKSKYNLI